MRYLQLFEKFYKPPPEIKERLDNIVKDLLKKHNGGRVFRLRSSNKGCY